MLSSFEKSLAQEITDNLSDHELVDTFSHLASLNHNDGSKFSTWKRLASGSASILDRIIISEQLGKPSAMFVSWGDIPSDHAIVNSYIETSNEKITHSPGYLKLNTKVLNSPNLVKEIRDEFQTQIDSTPAGWDPHQKL
jgi:hypothetical protein